MPYCLSSEGSSATLYSRKAAFTFLMALASCPGRNLLFGSAGTLPHPQTHWLLWRLLAISAVV